jgi:hypothetical protein
LPVFKRRIFIAQIEDVGIPFVGERNYIVWKAITLSPGELGSPHKLHRCVPPGPILVKKQKICPIF